MHVCFRMRISTKGTQQIQERVPREALPWTNNPHKKIKKQLVSTPMNFISQKIWDSWVSKNILLHDDPISFLRISLFRGDFVLFVIAFVLALEPATEGAIFAFVFFICRSMCFCFISNFKGFTYIRYDHLPFLLVTLPCFVSTVISGLTWLPLFKHFWNWLINYLWATDWWFGTWLFILPYIGNSSSQLTNSIIFQRGRVGIPPTSQY